jgi:hypothetical protein
MKKVNLIFFMIIILGLSTALLGSRLGLNISIGGYSLNSDRNTVYNRMTDFLEDIQYKDFKKAATYHSPEDQKSANIPELIENKFLIKPELMDIREFQIQKIDIDRSGDRARAHTMAHIKLLNSSELKDVESIFFWHKVDNVWYMQLKSSIEK